MINWNEIDEVLEHYEKIKKRGAGISEWENMNRKMAKLLKEIRKEKGQMVLFK